ncbi:MAG: hypothetical protein FWD73_04610 [Polyangiaceae bacterium]|nr:hypothetical protein [Polyangiaceae bacterium]
MATFQSPLLGYNNNVRHKNRMFHVQTEDSGINRPHVITHLFMDGGRILKSIKQSYAEHVGTDTVRDIVRTMMKDQHTAMIVALCDGQFDSLFDPSSVKATQSAHSSAPHAPSAQTRESLPTKQATPPLAAASDLPPESRWIASNSKAPAKSPARARVQHAGRYARARSSSIFSDPSRHLSSIFSDDLINDKSLDEVILNYLAEDLESSPHK